jgi:hypothetical protein
VSGRDITDYAKRYEMRDISWLLAATGRAARMGASARIY